MQLNWDLVVKLQSKKKIHCGSRGTYHEKSIGKLLDYVARKPRPSLN